jgi:FKBP-type peptidyl-prolyl cis-trans isomerase FkpA
MRAIRFISISFLIFLTACGSESTSEKPDLAVPAMTETASSDEGSLDKSDELAKVAYAMGANSGQFLARNLPEFDKWGMTFNPEHIKKGFIESLDGKSELTEEEIQTLLLAFQEKIKVKLAEIEEKQAKLTAETNKAFLDLNAAKEGIKVTASGLQYKIIEEGKGEHPKSTDTVSVHYRGSLTNGEEFDSSYSRNQPAEFALDKVITGWTEGLQLIKPGGKIELVLPPEIAYGDRSSPQSPIPANSVLVFEVELLAIIQPEKTESK